MSGSDGGPHPPNSGTGIGQEEPSATAGARDLDDRKGNLTAQAANPSPPIALRSNAAPEHLTVRKERQTEPKEPEDAPASKPTPFDQGLAKTDKAIKWFTVVSGVSAAISACAAIYTASQIRGSTRQVDTAIGKIAEAAKAAQAQATELGFQLGQMRRQADAAESSAKSASAQLAEAARADEPILVDSVADVPASEGFGPTCVPGTQRFGFNWGLRNIGRTAALDIQISELVSIAGGHYKWLGGRHHDRLSPSSGMWSTAFYGEPNSCVAARDAMIKREPIQVRIDLHYRDEGGHPQSALLCWLVRGVGAIKLCGKREAESIPIDNAAHENS